jgi:hypothetical protein
LVEHQGGEAESEDPTQGDQPAQVADPHPRHAGPDPGASTAGGGVAPLLRGLMPFDRLADPLIDGWALIG